MTVGFEALSYSHKTFGQEPLLFSRVRVHRGHQVGILVCILCESLISVTGRVRRGSRKRSSVLVTLWVWVGFVVDAEER